MKTNKKFIVSSLATIMAVSMVGAITGTVAWYQYSTRATVSMIGFNVAETGMLEISTTSASAGFKRDLTSADILAQVSTDDERSDFKLVPCTFTGANMTATGALPATAYKNPDVSNKVVKSDGSDYATRGTYADAWDVASAKTDYIQFDLWVRAQSVDNVSGGLTQTAEDVYLTDFVLANIGTGLILEGLRIHMAIDGNGDGDLLDAEDGYHLFSNTAKADLNLYGYLDQDNDGICDRVGGYEWATHRSDHIVYGEGTYTQNTATLTSMKASRDSSNNYAIAAGDAAKKLFTTPTSGASHIVMTIWVEGWDLTVGSKSANRYTYDAFETTAGTTDVTGKYYQYKLGNTAVDNNYVAVSTAHAADLKAVAGYNYFTQSSPTVETVADWSGLNTDGAAFQFGLTFDVGRGSFAD